LKSEGFHVLATKKKSLALRSTEQLIKKKEENMISGFVGGKGCFISLGWLPSLFLSLFLFIS
jgi:hypothetical protein